MWQWRAAPDGTPQRAQPDAASSQAVSGHQNNQGSQKQELTVKPSCYSFRVVTVLGPDSCTAAHTWVSVPGQENLN